VARANTWVLQLCAPDGRGTAGASAAMAPLLQRQAAQTGNASSFKQAMMPSLPAGARPILRRCTGSGASSSNGARRGQIQVSCSLVKRAEDVHAGAVKAQPLQRAAR
jgi:hypothetical protein